MKKIIIAALFGLFVFSGSAQKKALWIGNSYTGVNNLPNLTNQIANSLNDTIEFDSNTPGGNTFQQHANNPVNYQKIHSNDWDVVILQAQSQEPSFPDSQVESDTYPYAKQLNDSIQSILTCAETMFYMTWGREHGDPQWAPISTFEGMNERLENAYIQMANDNDASVAPVGVAWKYVRDHYPSINLYSGDGSHPSFAGSYLAACVFYSNIFNKKTINTQFIGSLDSTTAVRLRRVADSTVFSDRFSQWRNGSYNAAYFSAEQVDLVFNFTNNSVGDGLTYKWLFGDGNESTEENPSHVYSSSNQYEVTLISYSSCGNDTTKLTVDFNGAFIEELENDTEIWVDSNGALNFSSENGFKKEIEIVNLTGQQIYSSQFVNSKIISLNYEGIVLVKIMSGNNNIQTKKMKL